MIYVYIVETSELKPNRILRDEISREKFHS